MAVLWAITDSVTESGATIAVRVTSGTNIRLAVSTSASLSSPAIFGPVAPVDGVAKIEVTGRTTDTRYYYAPEVDGVIDTGTIGAFLTDPPLGEPADVTIRAFSCAGQGTASPGSVGGELAPTRVSDSPNFQNIAKRVARRTVHMGDWTYYNLGSDSFGIVGGASVSNIRKLIDDFASQPNQRALYLDEATVFQTDDHELQDNHNKDDPGLPALRQVFSERFPHRPLLVPGTLYREEEIGRALYVYLDVRSQRDANTDPDGPTKTMLGEGQRFRLQQIMTAVNPRYKVIVLFSPSVWHEPGREDGWYSFQNEQQWLINLIDANGWTGKVAIVSGDVHALGIDSGGNSPGGIPCATFASMDSDFGSPQNHNDLGPTSPGRNRYGTVRVNDLGSRIEVTLTGFIGATRWKFHTFGFDVDDDEDPGPIPEPPPAAAAVPHSTIQWLACDLVTGDRLAFLPGLRGSISRALGAYTQETQTLPIPLYGPSSLGPLLYDVLEGCGRVMICAIVNDVPAWGGVLLKASGGTEVDVSLALSTLECFLGRRYVGDHKWTNRDEAVIVTGLVNDAQDQGIGLIIDAPLTGTLRDREYFDKDDGRVYDRLTELSNVEDGPEWTIDLAWKDSTHRSIAKIFRLRKRIGKSVPTATISTKGAAKATYTYTVSYADGDGATSVMATTSGEGQDRPQSEPVIADGVIASGMPRWEYRFSPSSSIKETETLRAHARQRLIEIGNGTRSIEVTARWDQEPVRLGVDIQLGDEVEFDLYGHMHPNGLRGTGRIVGWKLDPQAGTYSPTILLPGQGGEGAE